ncbi:ArsR/SmtB family transcription factor [Salegentibacter sediminis]|uniref:ArsR/SmtB family transcription factor n=1 Tax=Salegentibacter sediminis TaxID=1930251 RepID=UPI0009BF0417|nr:metalloregulator ArsR/SmtB family transcription factor [Salegentibacter sediminis]
MDKRVFKDQAYNELAKITKALGNPRRLEIVDLLAQGPFSVEKIAEQTSLSIANASQHLQVLKGARLVEIDKKGNFIYYRLTNDEVFKTWRALRDLGFRLNAEAEKLVNNFYRSGQKPTPIPMEDLYNGNYDKDTLILDVRPGEEYHRGHIANAISIPINELSERLGELPSDVKIIAYCRGPLCVYADEAVNLLRKNGIDARRLKEGFPDWKSQGFSVEMSN